MRTGLLLVWEPVFELHCRRQDLLLFFGLWLFSLVFLTHFSEVVVDRVASPCKFDLVYPLAGSSLGRLGTNELAMLASLVELVRCYS